MTADEAKLLEKTLDLSAKTHDKVIKLTTVLLGANGAPGLVESFLTCKKDTEGDIKLLEKKITKNRLIIYAILALLGGADIVSRLGILP